MNTIPEVSHHKIKYLISIEPEQAKENLTQQEWANFIYVIDKLANSGIKVNITYYPISDKPIKNFDEEFGFMVNNGFTSKESYLKVKEYAQQHQGYC